MGEIVCVIITELIKSPILNMFFQNYYTNNLGVEGEVNLIVIQLREGHTLEIGQRVKVYRNLHKGAFSIQDAKSKLVIAYGDGFLLSDVNMNVSKYGRNRVLETKQKCVHAYIVGDFKGFEYDSSSNFRSIYYNPYITENFILLDTNESIFHSKYCVCLSNKCYVFDEID
jgi:hypothetical protein